VNYVVVAVPAAVAIAALTTAGVIVRRRGRR
jgi:hypothetical protein